MSLDEVLELFEEIKTPDPEDMVIEQIRRLIVSERLPAGARLPSERRLEERFKLPRGVISRAFRRMEAYGILKTLPQSGTYIAELSVQALDGLIANVLTPDETQVGPLMDIRAVLEGYAVELAVPRLTEGELHSLTDSVESLRTHLRQGRAHYDEDMVFHLRLAAYSGNPVLKSELTKLIVTSMELLHHIEQTIPREQIESRLRAAADEHDRICQALLARDAAAASAAVAQHFASAAAFLDSI